MCCHGSRLMGGGAKNQLAHPAHRTSQQNSQFREMAGSLSKKYSVWNFAEYRPCLLDSGINAVVVGLAEWIFGRGLAVRPYVLHLPHCFAGCASALTLPVAVVTKAVPGGIMRGSNTISGVDASFEVSDGKLSCSGSYSPVNYSTTITVRSFATTGARAS